MSARAEGVVVKRPGFGARFVRRQSLGVAVEKTRGALTALNLHFAGVALLVLLNIYLLIHMAFLWQTANSQDATAVAQEKVRLQTAKIAAAPLDGLDAKLDKSTADANEFYQARLPYAISQVAMETGAVAKKQNAKMTRVQYGYTPLYLDGTAPGPDVTPSVMEVRMDASFTGDYRALVQMVNDLERDRMFFLITGVTLTGQQSGTVSLRMKLTTYLRPAHGNEKAEPLPSGDADDKDGDAAATLAGGTAQ
jgi:type IV pilus assembly protein PilO